MFFCKGLVGNGWYVSACGFRDNNRLKTWMPYLVNKVPATFSYVLYFSLFIARPYCTKPVCAIAAYCTKQFCAIRAYCTKTVLYNKPAHNPWRHFEQLEQLASCCFQKYVHSCLWTQTCSTPLSCTLWSWNGSWGLRVSLQVNSVFKFNYNTGFQHLSESWSVPFHFHSWNHSLHCAKTSQIQSKTVPHNQRKIGRPAGLRNLI